MQHHSNPSLCPNHWCPRSWSWPVLWRSTRPSRTNTKKRCSFYHRGLECKNRKLRNTSITGKFGLRLQNKAGQGKTVLSREHAGHSKHTFPATQETTVHIDIDRWSIMKSDWLCSLKLKMKKLYTVSKNKTLSWLWLRSLALFCKIQV